MHLISLEAENVLRISAIRIKPNGKIIEITGPNGAGKSSTLNCISMALEGKSAIAWKPLREGAEKGKIVLEVGGKDVEYIITRRFNRTDTSDVTTSLTVESAKGARYSKPQAILDALLGKLSFDPLAFSRMAPPAQYDTLKKLVPGVDFDALEDANVADFTARTDANRRAKELRAQLALITITTNLAPRQNEDALIAELDEAGQKNLSAAQERARREKVRTEMAAAVSMAGKRRQEAEDLRRRASSLNAEADGYDRDAATIRKQAESWEALPDPVDTAELRAKITAARSHNEEIDRAERVNRQAEELGVDLNAQEKKSAELTAAMDGRKKQKVDAIAAAKLPVDGLSLGDKMVLFNGLPLDQASDAERLRVSVAIAAGMNPELRLILVRDGSLLDKRSWKLLADLAEERDLQILIETVDSSRPGAIVLEDGHIASIVQQAAE
jgi:DNA repair exonuclease SbcCD ATPase subunit